MKTGSSTFKVFLLNAIFILSCVGFAGITKCGAQSIVGKWKTISNRYYYSAEGAKSVGKEVVKKSTKEYSQLIEFKPDHTFTEVASGVKIDPMGGKWSLSGNQLTMVKEQIGDTKIENGESTTSAISVNGNTLVITTASLPPNNKTITKIAATLIKM